MLSSHLVHGGVHLSPDVEGQIQQQEQQVSHREGGQEQGGVVISVTLPPGQYQDVCIVGVGKMFAFIILLICLTE